MVDSQQEIVITLVTPLRWMRWTSNLNDVFEVGPADTCLVIEFARCSSYFLMNSAGNIARSTPYENPLNFFKMHRQVSPG